MQVVKYTGGVKKTTCGNWHILSRDRKARSGSEATSCSQHSGYVIISRLLVKSGALFSTTRRNAETFLAPVSSKVMVVA